RWKHLLRKCPHHQVPNWMQVQTFYNGLNTTTRQLVDASAGGTLNYKTPNESLKLFEDMARNNYHWGNNKEKQKVAGKYEIDVMTTIFAKMDALSKQVMEAKNPTASSSGICSAENYYLEVPEQVDYVGNQGRYQNNPYSQTYNPGWRNHPNFSYANNQNVQRPNFPLGYQKPQLPHPLPQEKKPSLEELLIQFIHNSESRHRNQEASIHNLENQIGQLAKMQSERQLGSLPSNTETNPKEEAKAITLRSGK